MRLRANLLSLVLWALLQWKKTTTTTKSQIATFHVSYIILYGVKKIGAKHICFIFSNSSSGSAIASLVSWNYTLTVFAHPNRNQNGANRSRLQSGNRMTYTSYWFKEWKKNRESIEWRFQEIFSLSILSIWNWCRWWWWWAWKHNNKNLSPSLLPAHRNCIMHCVQNHGYTYIVTRAHGCSEMQSSHFVRAKNYHLFCQVLNLNGTQFHYIVFRTCRHVSIAWENIAVANWEERGLRFIV